MNALRQILERSLGARFWTLLMAGLVAGPVPGHAAAGQGNGALAAVNWSHVWRYNAGKKDLGTAWREANFDDARWASGPGPLGFETTPEKLSMRLQTTIKKHGDITYYFRTTFTMPPGKGKAGYDLVFTNMIDDGAVCYLNGVEVWRDRMPAGAIKFSTAANRKADNAHFKPVTVPGTPLHAGTNVLAVEVHQINKSSSDMVMGLSLTVVPVRPTALAITAPPKSLSVRERKSATLKVSVSGRGAVYQWLKNNTAIAGANQAQLVIPEVTFADAGNYRVIARNAVNTVTSPVATLKVLPGRPPVITQQPTNCLALVGEPVTLEAVVSGDAPFFFQWSRDGQLLAGQTNRTLSLPRPFPSSAGRYALRVSNYFGQVTSRPAVLTVKRHERGHPGSVDRNFVALPSLHVRAVVVQPDGRILIGGSFASVNQTQQKLLARLLPDGSLDDSFKPVFVGPSDARINVIKLREDGGIYAGGVFSKVNGKARQSLVLLRPDGSLDAEFAPPESAPGWVRDVALLPDGKLIAVGGTGPGDAEMARLDRQGQVELNFPVGPEASYLATVAVQADGRILVGGVFRQYAGQEQHYLARVRPDGSLDASFLPGSQGPNSVVQYVRVVGDKIWIGGNFTSIHGHACNGLVRLNLDGTPDPAFRPPDIRGGVYNVDCILPQTDGKIIVTGDFTRVDNVLRKGLARLLPDGRLDASFDIGSGAGSGYDRVRRVALTADGDVLCAGFFTEFDEVAQPYLARLVGRR